jgi:acetylornithine/N-succinyldiaminopimelate aminotransferase
MKSPIIPFYKQFDKFIVKSNDCFLFDSEGKKYIDFESGDWAACLGHSHKRINKVIKNQVNLLIHDGLRFRNKLSDDLSLLLLEKLSMEGGKSAFLNSGSEAVNLAITITKNLTKRGKILKMDCSYLSAYGHGQNSSTNTGLLNIPIDDIDFMSMIDFGEIAAFVFEPGNSSSLIKYPSNDFIAEVAQTTKQNGGLLIANEVTTGFGRTGKWFGFQHYNYKPDIVAIGKALGNGYPISGVVISNDVSELFNKSPFRYAQSHQNDPLGCAVGLEVIQILEQDGLIHNSCEKGKYFKDRLMALQAQHSDKIKEIRARGLMIGMELFAAANAENMYMQLIDFGFLVGYKENVLRFMPPLIIEKKHIDAILETVDKLLAGTKSI